MKNTLNFFFRQIEIPGTIIQIGELTNVLAVIKYGEEFDYGQFIDQHPGKNLYFLSGIKPEIKDRAKDIDIIKKNYIGLDFDILEEQSKTGLKGPDNDLKRIANEILEKLKSYPDFQDYSYAVLSGRGLHVYYFGETIGITDPEIFKLGMLELITIVNQQVGAPIPADSSCINTSRLFRIPTSINQKNKTQSSFIYSEYKPSPLLGKIISMGKEREQRMEEEAKIDVKKFNLSINSQPGDVYQTINQIPIQEIICNEFGWKVADDNSHFRDPINNPSKSKACFVSKNGNYIIHGGTNHFSDAQKGYSPFAFIKNQHKLNNRQAFEWFENKYPQIKELAKKQKDEYNVNQNSTNTTTEDKGFTIVSCREMMRKKIKVKPYIVDLLVPESAITAITADSGKGKSLIMDIMADKISKGEKLFDQFETKKSKVLILDLEMDEDIIVGRVQSIMNEQADIDFIYEQPFNIETDHQKIKNLILKNGYKVIVFDTLTEIHNAQENESGPMKQINQLLRRLIKEASVTIIYLHHHRKPIKGEKQSQSSSRGSTEIIGKVASHLIIDSEKLTDEEHGNFLYLTIQQAKQRRPEGSNKIGLKIFYNRETKKTTYEYLGEIDEAGRKKDQIKKQIIEIFNDNKGEKYSVEELAEKTSAGKSNLRSALRELVAEKTLDSAKSGKANYYFLHS